MFIMEAEDPQHKIRLENRATCWTDSQESWLHARWAQGPGTQSAEDQDDPFADLRASTSLRLDSYGIHIDSQHESLEKVVEAEAFAKAVKADDAGVPVHLWNDRIRTPLGATKEQRDRALEGFRKLDGHRWFLRSLLRDCVAYTQTTYGSSWKKKTQCTKEGHLTKFGRDRRAMEGMLWHLVHTSWCDYHTGSRLFHFRFPPRYRAIARNGVKAYFERPGPTTREPQPSIADPNIWEMAREKISKVVRRRYLVSLGIKVKSYIKYFAVPKGEDDIRMVYDATANHLNECVWVPSSWLPTVDSLVRALDKDSWMTDRDVQDMFLNYPLHEDVSPYTGMDLSSLYQDGDESGPRWAVWDRNLMGMPPPPTTLSRQLSSQRRFAGQGESTQGGHWHRWQGVESFSMEPHTFEYARN